MSDSAPHPDLAGLAGRQAQLTAKLEKLGANGDPKVIARTRRYLAEVEKAIKALPPVAAEPSAE